MAARVAVLSGLRGVARIDFLAEGDQLYVNEINTIPGSLSWYLWVDPPVPFAQLLDDMLAEAASRPSAYYTTAGADGTALRSAGSIASKLG
jgi:D-alanine-D-alanine ligase